METLYFTVPGKFRHIRKGDMMNEIEKMYENAYKVNKFYPPFTTEKQIAIEEVILQNKKNYNKWIEYNINVYGEWVIRFVRTDKFAPYVALEKTRSEALANIINYIWQDLTKAEQNEIREILK